MAMRYVDGIGIILATVLVASVLALAVVVLMDAAGRIAGQLGELAVFLMFLALSLSVVILLSRVDHTW